LDTNQDRATKANDTWFNICCSTKMLNESRICWKVVVTCWILVQLMLSNICPFWQELWNGGWRNVIIALRCKRCRCNHETLKKKRRKNGLENGKKTSFGAYYTPLAELRNPYLHKSHFQSSIPIQPQFQLPCWIFPSSHMTPNSKKIHGRRPTSGNLLKGIDSNSILFNNVQLPIKMLNSIFQHSTILDTLFNISWVHLLLNKCWAVYHWLKIIIIMDHVYKHQVLRSVCPKKKQKE